MEVASQLAGDGVGLLLRVCAVNTRVVPRGVLGEGLATPALYQANDCCTVFGAFEGCEKPDVSEPIDLRAMSCVMSNEVCCVP